MKIYLLVLIVFFVQIQAKAQKRLLYSFDKHVRYSLYCAPNSNELDKKMSINFDLYIKDSLSYFAEAKTVQADSVYYSLFLRSEKPGGQIQELMSEIGKAPKPFYYYRLYNYSYKGVYLYIDRVNNMHAYSAPIDKMNWILEDSSKVMNGYVAKKAQCNFKGRAYTAWYTEEIPIPVGPYKFNGLPGLILDIADSEEHFRFSFNGFEVGDFSVAIAEIDDGIEHLSKDAFMSLKKEYYKNPRPYIEQNNEMKGRRMSSDMVQMAVDNITKRGINQSNDIERE